MDTFRQLGIRTLPISVFTPLSLLLNPTGKCKPFWNADCGFPIGDCKRMQFSSNGGEALNRERFWPVPQVTRCRANGGIFAEKRKEVEFPSSYGMLMQ